MSMCIIAGVALVDQDQEQLRLLSILHYAYSGIAAMFACVPVVFATIGVFLLTNPGKFGGGRNAPPVFVGSLFATLGVATALLGWAGAICCFLTGRFLARRRHWVFCMIGAGMNCTQVPLGTALAVFTMVVLLRPEVKAMFVQPSPLPAEFHMPQSS